VKKFTLFRHIRNNFLLYILLGFTTWLFFYRLDYQTLTSWDEAWYASIAKDIIKTNDWVNLTFNGEPFFDHPPMGFWFMVASYKLFGVSEFSTRLPSALSGVLSVILLYFFGQYAFKKKEIGFVAGMILATSVWYVLRTRSGNLDALFLFFYIATVFTAFLSTKSFRWFLVCMMMFGALIMTKTLAGTSAAILILWLILPYAFKSKRNLLYLALGGIIFYIIVFPWYQYQLSTHSDFYQQHFINIGQRNRELNFVTLTHLEWQLPLFYLHMGVRKWYYIWQLTFIILSIGIIGYFIYGLTLFAKKKKFNNWEYLHKIFGLIIWNVVILYPFLTTSLTEIWHLIPTYAPLALVISVGSYHILESIIYLGKKLLNQFKFKSHLNNIFTVTKYLYILPFLILAVIQLKIFYYEVIPSSKYVVDEVDILKTSVKYLTKETNLLIDRDYVPIAVFYTNHSVIEHTRESDDVGTIQKVFDQRENFILIIRNGIVDNYQKAGLPYKLKAKNNSFSIITEK